MTSKYIALLAYILLFPIFSFGLMDVDFDESTGIDLMKKYSVSYEEKNANQKIDLLRQNYLRLKPSQIANSKEAIIPKIMHLIWLGNESIPSNFQYYLNTCKEYHPGWEIKIWTEKEIVTENLQNIDLYNVARSYAEQSDIVRYEILYKYGGLYLDFDIECFSSFEELNYKYNFYANLEPPAINKKRVTIGNNLIASVAGHPVLLETLSQIRRDWDKVEEEFTKKFSTDRSSFARSSHHLAVHRTMYPLTDEVMNYLTKSVKVDDRLMILPSGYNLPLYFLNDMPFINFLSKIFRNKGKLNNHIVIKPETLSFHFYDKENSFLKKDDFANSLFDHSRLKGAVYTLLNLRDKYYLLFRKLFQTNAPYLVPYKTESTIPKIIYLNNSTNLTQEKIVELGNQWHQLNYNFKIVHVKDEDLYQRIYRLYETGGTYVDSNFEPVALKEFHYKFGYFGKLKKLDSLFERVSIDYSIMGFSEGHNILNQIIKALEKKDLSNKKTISFQDLLTDIVYKYHLFDGKSIVLPEIYFDEKRYFTK